MEVAGIVIGGVGLVVLFDNCMNAFQCIDAGRKYGKDYQEAALKVSLIQLRLARWRKTVDIVEDTSRIHRQKDISFASEDGVEIVRDLLESIQIRFHEIEKASMRHGIKWNNSLSHANDLVELFPGNKQQQLALAKKEAQELMILAGAEDDCEAQVAASLLDKVSQEVDPQLRKALEKLGRHSFGNATIRDSARVQQGDQVAENYQGQRLAGGGHTYGSMGASGQSRILQGDTYGRKSIWDD